VSAWRCPRPVLLAAVAAASLLLGAAAAGAWAWRALRAPHRDWQGGSVTVDLPRDLPAGTMLERLGRAGVVRHPALARAYVSLRGWDRELKAGEYRFERAASILEILDRLRRGDVLLHAVTVPEGLTVGEVAQKVAEAGFATLEDLLAAFRDTSRLPHPAPGATDLEGYLFPDTYAFPRGERPEAIVDAMLRRFAEVTGPGYAERARAHGLSVRQAVTLASLIEKETGIPEERALVSRVFHNRLARGMLLQCDPTVAYAIRRSGRMVTRLLQADLKFPSSWNTYLAPGLPPGPICSPGQASLLAAVNPAPGDELYFVAAPGGGHRFSKDLASHERAVRVWRLYGRSSR